MSNMSNTKLWAITILGLAVGWVVFKAAPALQSTLVALMVAYLLNPLVELIEKRFKIRKEFAITFLFASIIITLVILGNLIIPPIVKQATEFIKEFQSISGNINRIVEDILVSLDKLGLSQGMIVELKQFAAKLVNSVGNYLISVITSALGYIFKVVDLLLILIMSIYFLASGKKMIGYIVNHIPQGLLQTTRNLMEGADRVIWSYMKTQALIALIIGVMSTTAFLLIDVRFSVLLGVIAGIFNFIPYFGSLFSGALAILIALLTRGYSQAVVVVVAVLIIQQIESNFITPRLQGKAADMHPAVIIISVVIGDYFWGTAGMFVAVPLLGLARLFFTETIKLIKQIE